MNKDTVRQWVTLVAVIVTLIVNGLANALPFNAKTTGEISDRFQVYFVPAAYVFAIWGVIYAGLLALAFYQLLPAQRENPRLRQVGYLLVLSCVANCAWIFLWHYELFPATIVVMIVLLLSLVAIYLRLGIGYARFSTAEKWCVSIPISIYLGWITVATIANATTLLAYLNWGGWGIAPAAWAVIMLGAGVAIASAVSLTRGDIPYMLVIIWAFAGIAVRHASTPLVAISAWVATAIAALMLVVGAVYHRRRLVHAY